MLSCCLLTEKFTIITHFSLLLFLYFTLGRKQVASPVLVLGGCTPTMRVDGGLKRVKECTRQLWKIIVGEWSHCENLSISVTRHFHYMRPHPHIHQSAFKDFSLLLFKRPNKLELLSRGWSTAYGASDVFGWQTKLNELLSIVASGRRRTFTWKVPCGECETKWKSCDENLMKAKNIFPDENYLHLTQFEWHKVRIKLPRSDSNWYYVP